MGKFERTRDELIKAMVYAKRSHTNWACIQRRRRTQGKRPVRYIGGESFHRRWAKIYDDVLEVLGAA